MAASNAPTPAPRHEATRNKGRTTKGRARLVTALAFALTLPALALGVGRANGAGDEVNVFAQAHALFDEARSVEMSMLKLKGALVLHQSDPNVDHFAALERAFDATGSAIRLLEDAVGEVRSHPALDAHLKTWTADDGGPLFGQPVLEPLSSAVMRARVALIDDKHQNHLDPSALRRAEDALSTAMTFVHTLTFQSRRLTQERAEVARGAMSKAERDQLVVFLLALSAFPLVTAFGPSWALAPIAQLRSIASRIQAGRTAHFSITGDDEVAEVSLALHQALVRLEESDARKTGKILEMKKLARSVLGAIHEPVVVLGRGGRIDYANEDAAKLFGREVHHIEKLEFEEVVFAPELLMHVDAAWTGELPKDAILARIEGADGRVQVISASLQVVQDQSGTISRVIIALPTAASDDADDKESP